MRRAKVALRFNYLQKQIKKPAIFHKVIIHYTYIQVHFQFHCGKFKLLLLSAEELAHKTTCNWWIL